MNIDDLYDEIYTDAFTESRKADLRRAEEEKRRQEEEKRRQEEEKRRQEEEKRRQEEEKRKKRNKIIKELLAAAVLVTAAIAIARRCKKNMDKKNQEQLDIMIEFGAQLHKKIDNFVSLAKSGKMTNSQYEEAKKCVRDASEIDRKIMELKGKMEKASKLTTDMAIKMADDKNVKSMDEIIGGFIPAGRKKNMSADVRDVYDYKKAQQKIKRKESKEQKREDKSRERRNKRAEEGPFTQRVFKKVSDSINNLRQNNGNNKKSNIKTYWDKNGKYEVASTKIEDLLDDSLFSEMTEAEQSYYIECWEDLLEESAKELEDTYNNIVLTICEKSENGTLSIGQAALLLESADKIYME